MIKIDWGMKNSFSIRDKANKFGLKRLLLLMHTNKNKLFFLLLSPKSTDETTTFFVFVFFISKGTSLDRRVFPSAFAFAFLS